MGFKNDMAVRNTGGVSQGVGRHPEWITITLELLGFGYLVKLVWGIYFKIHRAVVIIRGLALFLAVTIIIWLCWNYVYIEGVSPFNGRIHPDYQIVEQSSPSVEEVILEYQRAQKLQ